MNQETSADYGDHENEISLLDLLYTVVSNWRLLIFGPVVAGLLALWFAYTIPPIFTATTKFLPPQQQSAAAAMLQNLGSLGGLAGAASGLKNPAEQYVAFLKSRTVQQALVDRFKLKSRYEVELNEDSLGALGNNARISSGKDGLITIDVDDKEPAFAAQLANAHVEELSKLLGRLAVTEAQQRRVFFEKQLQQTKVNLTKAEQDLKATGVNASVLKANPAAAVAAVAQLQAQITGQEVKLASMRGYLTESAPEFKQARVELAALRAEGVRAAGSSPQSDSSNSDYVTRYREMKYHETLFDLFARQFELAKIDESREGAVIQVLDIAQPPERKSKPKKGLIVVSTAFMVWFVLLLFVFVRQAFRNQPEEAKTVAKLARLRTAWR